MGGESILTLDRKTLLEYLEYNPETGIFIWIKRPANRVKVGAVAGIEMPNATYITLKGKRFMAHRAAWLIFYGKEPENVIDHMNGNPNDNRICNLRDVPHSENCKNQKLYVTNTTGIKGVYLNKQTGSYYAQIVVDNKTKCLGSFKNLEDAAAARKAAESKYNFYNREEIYEL